MLSRCHNQNLEHFFSVKLDKKNKNKLKNKTILFKVITLNYKITGLGNILEKYINKIFLLVSFLFFLSKNKTNQTHYLVEETS